MNVVIGLGLSGVSIVKFLRAQDEAVVVIDTRETIPNLAAFTEQYPDVTVYQNGLDKLLELKFDRVILSPGVDRRLPAIQQVIANNISVIGDVELFAQHNQKPVIAITGTNGKTTVTTMVTEMLLASGIRALAAGNIGVPVLDALQQDVDVYVLELSSYQLESTFSLAPDIAVVLNIAPDHQDRYENLQAYLAAKLRIYQGAKKNLINADDPRLMRFDAGVAQWQFALQESHLSNSSTEHFYVHDGALKHNDEVLISLEACVLKGQHHQQNALASVALSLALGAKKSAIVDVLTTFSGVPHRCEQVATINGVTWINDSKGTNVAAVVAALQSIPEKEHAHVILLAGGELKEDDLTPLVQAVAGSVKKAILFGRDAKKIAAEIPVPYVLVEDMYQAVALAKAQALEGEVVILSPACASFDQFNSYAHRGEVFKQLVKSIHP